MLLDAGSGAACAQVSGYDGSSLGRPWMVGSFPGRGMLGLSDNPAFRRASLPSEGGVSGGDEIFFLNQGGGVQGVWLGDNLWCGGDCVLEGIEYLGTSITACQAL